MSNKKFWLNIFFILISVAGVVAFLISIRQAADTKPVPSTGKKERQDDSDQLVGMKLKIPGSDKNSYWDLNVASLDSLDNIGHMKGIKGQYYSNKKPVYHLSAQSGLIFWKTKILKLKGKVSLSTNDNRLLTAEVIAWDPNTNKVTAKNNVILKTAKLTVRSTAIITNLSMNQATFSQNTTALYER